MTQNCGEKYKHIWSNNLPARATMKAVLSNKLCFGIIARLKIYFSPIIPAFICSFCFVGLSTLQRPMIDTLEACKNCPTQAWPRALKDPLSPLSRPPERCIRYKLSPLAVRESSEARLVTQAGTIQIAEKYVLHINMKLIFRSHLNK